MKYAYFIWKNLTRKKARTLLTLLSIFVAFVLFGLLGALNQAFTGGADAAGADRLVTIHKISLVNFLPISYVARVEQVQGVKDVTHATWFGGYYQEQRNMFAQFPVDAESYLKVYKKDIVLSDQQKQAWLKNRIGAVVGEKLVRRYGWKIGDRIPVTSTIFTHDGNFTLEFEIEGTFTATDSNVDTSYMLFHYDYFDESRDFAKGQIGWMGFSINEPDKATQISKSVDELFANSSAETKTSTEKAFAESFAKQFGDIGLITKLIMTAVFFTMLLVTGNTMAQTVRERIPELAVLKTIGFSDGSMLFWVLGESVTIALVGGALALIVDFAVVNAMAASVGAFLPGLSITAAIFFQGLGLAIIFGILSGIFPAIRAMRLSITDALMHA
ncbi:MAG: ABC transporter permease [Gammaproteobacteria bacterium]|nr:ABC transporter permease [Gammaproteobacteria bacterium]